MWTLNGSFLVQFCVARNWVVRNFYPVHSFLKPAAFDCGPLHATSAAAPAAEPKEAAAEQSFEAKRREKLTVDLPKEQAARGEDESSPLHRHGSCQDRREWPSQTSVSVIA